MKNLILLILMAFSLESFSQALSINDDGSAPDASSILDIKSRKHGFLLPRVSLKSKSDQETIKKPVNSLIVYNQATSEDGTMIPGFYYWDGEVWRKLSDGLDLKN
ncbi:MAG: hypothetical protein MRY83_14740 [Flavobacteriales bacterium]|nr:hypothetical protein [Flavobacteriales bacterium]